MWVHLEALPAILFSLVEEDPYPAESIRHQEGWLFLHSASLTGSPEPHRYVNSDDEKKKVSKGEGMAGGHHMANGNERFTSRPVDILSVNAEELNLIQTALMRSSLTFPDAEDRKKIRLLWGRLGLVVEKAVQKHPNRIQIPIKPAEYNVLLEALEFYVASTPLRSGRRQDVAEYWAQLLVEGGHVDPEELTLLRERYSF